MFCPDTPYILPSFCYIIFAPLVYHCGYLSAFLPLCNRYIKHRNKFCRGQLLELPYPSTKYYPQSHCGFHLVLIDPLCHPNSFPCIVITFKSFLRLVQLLGNSCNRCYPCSQGPTQTHRGRIGRARPSPARTGLKLFPFCPSASRPYQDFSEACT